MSEAKRWSCADVLTNNTEKSYVSALTGEGADTSKRVFYCLNNQTTGHNPHLAALFRSGIWGPQGKARVTDILNSFCDSRRRDGLLLVPECIWNQVDEGWRKVHDEGGMSRVYPVMCKCDPRSSKRGTRDGCISDEDWRPEDEDSDEGGSDDCSSDEDESDMPVSWCAMCGRTFDSPDEHGNRGEIVCKTCTKHMDALLQKSEDRKRQKKCAE